MKNELFGCASTALLLLGISSGCRAVPAGDDAAASTRPLVALSNMRHPPFSSWGADRRAVGLEIDLVAEAARRLGREVAWSERAFGELIPAVAGGEADVSASTIGITAERAALVAFSAAYFETSIVALARPGVGEPRSLAELRGRRVATERGTTTVQALAERVPGAVGVLDRTGEQSWGDMLSAGKIDAIVLDRSHAERFMAEAGIRLHVIEEPLRTERFAFALRHGADELRAALDEVIAEHLAALAPEGHERHRLRDGR